MSILLIAALMAAPAGDESEHHPAHRAHVARGNLGQYFTADDYPATAMQRGAEGTVAFRLQVDKYGHATGCTVTRSAGDPALDAVTCATLLARAQLEPARDDHGRPVPDTIDNQVRWRMVDSDRPEPQQPPIVMITWVEGSEDGIRCAVELNGREVESEQGFQCGSAAGYVRALASATPGAGARVAFVYTIELDSAPAQEPDMSAAGELVVDAAARISVAPDGQLAECRTTRFVVNGPGSAVEANRPDLCQLPSFINANFASPSANAIRFGQIRARVYLRAPHQPAPR